MIAVSSQLSLEKVWDFSSFTKTFIQQTSLFCSFSLKQWKVLTQDSIF